MKKEELILIGMRVLRFIFFGLFVIGCFFNYEGIDILRHASSYDSGRLEVDSLQQQPGRDRRAPTVMAFGRVNNVSTAIILGSIESEKAARASRAFYDEELNVPVWYRPDGQSTLDRYPEEKVFPISRVRNKLIWRLTLLNMPFIVVVIVIIFYKRKLKRNAQRED